MTARIRFATISGLVGILLFAAAAPPAQAAPRRRTITVRTAGQFVRALGSNRTIRVMPGTYVLTSVAKQGSGAASWSKQYDGMQLDVVGVKNLRIVGVGRKRPRLLARPRYAWVLKFVGTENVTLDNLVLGHTVSGACMGGVVAFDRSKKVKILRSELFGSGTYGVELNNVKGFLMDRSLIRGCTYGILVIKRSPGAIFKRSTFRNNKEFDLIDILRSRNVRFEQCKVSNNSAGRNGKMFSVDRASNVIIRGGTWSGNKIATFINRRKRLKIIGSAKLKRSIGKILKRADPRYNQIYRLVRYRKWLVTGSQAGIAFLDARTGKVALLKKAFIAGSVVVIGKHLWVGTYRRVFRFDGLKLKTYAYNAKARGHALVRNRKGRLYVRTRGGKLQRYDTRSDRLVPVKPAWRPAFKPYDLVFGRRGVVWAINFLAYVGRYKNGMWAYYRRRGYQYKGRDPRRFYLSPSGRLWVMDFGSGFFYYDAARDAFGKDPSVSSKGSDMVVDAKRKRTWFLHYTRGLYLKRPGRALHHINLSRQRYMRAVHLEKRNGTLWVGGHRGVVRIQYKGGAWKQKTFVVQ